MQPEVPDCCLSDSRGRVEAVLRASVSDRDTGRRTVVLLQLQRPAADSRVGAAMSTDQSNGLSLGVPPALVDAIATRVAERMTEQMPEPPTPYLKIEEAAEYLACPVSRIRDLKDQGKLRHYRDGRRLLFRREDLDGALTIREPEPR